MCRVKGYATIMIEIVAENEEEIKKIARAEVVRMNTENDYNAQLQTLVKRETIFETKDIELA